MSSMFAKILEHSVIFFFIIIPLIILLIWYFAIYQRKVAGKLLITETTFDLTYLEERKKCLDTLPGVIYPYNNAQFGLFSELDFVKTSKAPFNWYEEVQDNQVVLLETYDLGFLMSFIYEIYNDISDLESPLSKKLFEERTIKLDSFVGQIGLDLSTKVKGITTVITDPALLSFKEFLQIALLLGEVIINNLEDNNEKLTKLKEFSEDTAQQDIEIKILKAAIVPETYQQLKTTYEKLSLALKMNINVYDCRFNVGIADIENYSITAEEPTKTVSFIVSEEFNHPMRSLN